ncbi:Transcriptional regulator, ArsR family [Candidatus Terasakiella magnetica]|nr:Transcriptional regulator, ArsR family [Candidatus Terasakiella magnetica]
MEYAGNIFFALSDPIRLRSLALLATQGELCVCELTYALQAGQPQVSKHMATLRDAGLVKDRRDAQWVLYSLATDAPQWVQDAVAAAVTGISEDRRHADDVGRLKMMTTRPPRDRVA